MSIQFQGHCEPLNQKQMALAFQTFKFVFINSILAHYKKKKKSLQKPFRGSRLLKYLINVELIWLSVTR